MARLVYTQLEALFAPNRNACIGEVLENVTDPEMRYMIQTSTMPDRVNMVDGHELTRAVMRDTNGAILAVAQHRVLHCDSTPNLYEEIFYQEAVRGNGTWIFSDYDPSLDV